MARCNCGKEGEILLPRREWPYCRACFEQMLAREIRRESAERIIPLRPSGDSEMQVIHALIALCGKETVESTSGYVPGCQETQAAAVIEYVFGEKDSLEQHFPASITRQELQRFMSAFPPAKAGIEAELSRLETQHPGTIASIAKYAQDLRTQKKHEPGS